MIAPVPVKEDADYTSLREQLQAAFKQTSDGLAATLQVNQRRSEELRDKLFGTGGAGLPEAEQADVDNIVKILQMYQDLIGPTKIYLATLLRRKLEIKHLMEQLPGKTLDMLDEFETMLKAQVPEELWPENAAKTS